MSSYSISLTDLQEAGVTAACAEHNGDSKEPITNFEYVQMVMAGAADNYVNTYVKTDLTREQVAAVVQENEKLKEQLAEKDAAIAAAAAEAVPLKP